MPAASIFTPSHDPVYLHDAYASLCAQTVTDWEWIVYLNDGAVWAPDQPDDKRVVVFRSVDESQAIGALKGSAVDLCSAELIIELDHDDMLVSTAVEELIRAHEEYPDAGLYYSDTAAVDSTGAALNETFAEGNGWRYKAGKVDGVTRIYPQTPEPTPHNVGHIWFAPNHVRAFTRTAYDAVGGYDDTLEVLDDQDLMARLYQHGEFIHLQRCLYLQRHHAGQSQLQAELSARIQVGTLELYSKYIGDMAQAWAKREGLRRLTLGQVMDWDAPKPDSVGVITSDGLLDTGDDMVDALNEAYRVLVPGGLLLIDAADDAHSWFRFDAERLRYVTDHELARTVPGNKARFQISKLWDSTANLIALKGQDVRDFGPVRW